MRLVFVIMLTMYVPISHAQQCVDSFDLNKNLKTVGYVSLVNKLKITELNLSSELAPLQSRKNSLMFQVERVKNGSNLLIKHIQGSDKSKYLVSIPMRRYNDKHGGMSTLDTITLDWQEASLFPVITLWQTSLPAKAERNFMPGAPAPFTLIYQPQSQCFDVVSQH